MIEHALKLDIKVSFRRHAIGKALLQVLAALLPALASPVSSSDPKSRAFILLTAQSEIGYGVNDPLNLVAIDTSNDKITLSPKFNSGGGLTGLEALPTGTTIRVYLGFTDQTRRFNNVMDFQDVWTTQSDIATRQSIVPAYRNRATVMMTKRGRPTKMVIKWPGAEKPEIIAWKSFVRVSPYEVSDYIYNTSFSPSNNLVAISLDGAAPIFDGYDQDDTLTYIFDRIHHKLKFLGLGECAFWITDQELGVNFKPHLKDHMFKDMAQGFTPQCRVYDVATGKKGPVHDFEILASSPRFHRFLAIKPKLKPYKHWQLDIYSGRQTFFQTDENLKKLPLPEGSYIPIQGSWLQDYYAVGRP